MRQKTRVLIDGAAMIIVAIFFSAAFIYKFYYSG
jgi:uncharacterized protein YpmB